MTDTLPDMADLNLQMFEELKQAQARIATALELLRPEVWMTLQSRERHLAALIKALTA